MTEEEKQQFKEAKKQRHLKRRAQMTEEEKQSKRQQNKIKRIEKEKANPQLRERRLARYKSYKERNREVVLAYQREYHKNHRKELSEKRRSK